MKLNYENLRDLPDKEKLIDLTSKCIEHWKDNVSLAKDNNNIDITEESCALCSKFFTTCDYDNENDYDKHVELICPLEAIGNCCLTLGSTYVNITKITREKCKCDECWTDLLSSCQEMLSVLETIKVYLEKYHKEERESNAL